MGVIISTDIIIDILVGQRFLKHKPEQQPCLIDGEMVGVHYLGGNGFQVLPGSMMVLGSWGQSFQGRVKGLGYSW